MEPITTPDLDLDLEPDLDQRKTEELLVHEWRADQLRRLGLARAFAEAFVGLDHTDLDAATGRYGEGGRVSPARPRAAGMKGVLTVE